MYRCKAVLPLPLRLLTRTVPYPRFPYLPTIQEQQRNEIIQRDILAQQQAALEAQQQQQAAEQQPPAQ